MREDWSRLKAQRLRPALGVDDHAADDVRRHQIGRELNSRILQVQHPRQRAKERSLSQPRSPFQQHMAAREQTDQHAIHYLLLTYNDLADFGTNAIELRGSELEGGLGLHQTILSQAPILRPR